MAATDDSISIREHLETSVRNQREYIDLATKRNADSIVSLESRMTEINALHATAHAREHEMTKDALDSAKKSLDLRLDEMNEFRKQITDERATFLTKAEFARFEEGLQKELRVMATAWARLYGGAAAFTIVLGVLAVIGWMTR